MNSPLVHIVIPCWNASLFIPALFESLMAQTYNNWKVVAVDDQSTDNTVEVLFIVISGFSAWLSVGRKIGDRKAIGKLVINRYLRFAVPFGIVFTILYVLWFLGCFNYHSQAGEISGSKALATAFWPVSIVGFIKALLLSPVNPDFWDAPLWMMKYVFFGTYIAIIVRMGIDNMSPKCKLLALVVVLVLFGIGDIFYLGILIGFLFSYLYKQPVSTQKKLMGGKSYLSCSL